MKFSVTQEKLSKGLQTIFRAIPTKSSLPILANVLMEAKEGNLYLSATNLETAIKTTVGASIEQEGIVAVPARLLKEFITTLPATNLTAELKGYVLVIKSDKTKTKFNGVNAQDYPQLPTIPTDKKALEIDPRILENIAQMITFSAGTDTSRPVFTGIFLQFEKNNLIVAATDGFRLSELKVKVEHDIGKTSVLIPAKTFSEIARIFSNTEEKVKIYFNDTDNLLLFVAEDTMVATRILDGQYPDYKKIIPKEHILEATFSTEDFAEAVKVTSIFAKEANNTIKVKFDPVEHTVKVSSLAETSGENESIIQASVEGELLEVACNSRYLVDFLNNIKGSMVELKTNGAAAPCLITVPEHKDFIHIIMPLQI